MIRSFADKAIKELYLVGSSDVFPRSIIGRALRKLDMLNAARNVLDLREPPGNRLHQLQGKRKGSFAIAINSQWRLCFKFIGKDAYEVEICDYH